MKRDNDKLISMLKQTKEYQDFGDFIEDSGGQVRSLAPSSKPPLLQFDDSSWIPQDAYSLAHSFRLSHGSELTPHLINQLLTDLNRVWRERERKQISRIKQNSLQEIHQLKRQLSNRAPFDEVTAKKSIARLQRQLDEARGQIAAVKAGGGG